MPNLMLGWQDAGGAAAALIVVGLAAARLSGRRWRAAAPYLRETGIVLALYALWQAVGGISLMGTADAVRRGRWIWQHERAWHFPNEASWQHPVLHHSLLAQACNLYYATMHFGVLIAMLVWLFAWHRDAYPRVRTTIVLVTAACLLIEFIPVAPPRLVSGTGMVDLAAKYGQSVYAATAGIGSDQYSAMPSVHVAWAVLVAVAVIRVSRSRWRWLVLAHTALTLYVVVVTANHYWLDGVVAAALLVASLAAQAAGRAVSDRLRRRLRARGVLPDALDDLTPSAPVG